MARLSICTLGSFTAAIDGEVIHSFESDKARALLAYLAVEADRPHRREKLAALLWPDQNDEHAHASLSQALYSMRRSLGERGTVPPLLIVTQSSIQLNPQAQTWLDINEFKGLLSACENHAHRRLETCHECATHLEHAADLYQGEFLEGFNISRSIPYDEWVVITRERLNQQLLAILERLRAYHEIHGELSLALRYARRSVDLDPLSETGQRSLMRLLALDGQRQAALAQYNKFQDLLRVELSVEPEQETRLLHERLCQEPEVPRLTDRLPAHLTPFIGRRTELAELCALLRKPDCRLVTLVGAGGSGKTRLALQAADMLRFHFANDVYFVPLADLASPHSLLPAVTLALGLKAQEGTDPQAQLLEYLQDKHVLLLLDSFETVLEGRIWLSELLRSASGVKALVTSRVRLNIKGEHIFPLSGMRYPEPEKIIEAGFDPAGYSAMQLFTTGARFSHAQMDLDEETWGAVAKICQLVQGMPLGLLLASAWVENYSPAEIAAEIERSLDFLETTWADMPDRQRSLRATLDYSYQLLNPEEQELFCRLSVFRGGFTRQAATLVSGATPITLKGLLDKSMLQAQASGRYVMHDLVRQYAAEKLAQSPEAATAAHQAHIQYYTSALQTWTAGLKSSNQQKILVEMDADINNVHYAWKWSADTGDLATLGQMLEGICTYYELRRRYTEGSTACQAALLGISGREEPGAENLRGWLLAWQARFYRLVGEVECAKEMREASQAALERAEALREDNRRGQALLAIECGYTASNLPDQLKGLLRSAALFQALDDPWRQVIALSWAGEYANRLGEPGLGFEYLQEAVDIGRRVGEPWQLARALELLAYLNLMLGQWEIGARLMEEAAENFRIAGDPGQEGLAYMHLGMSLSWIGRFPEAKDLLERALPLLYQAGERLAIIFCKGALGSGQLFLGEYDQAGKTLREALEGAQRDNFPREIAFVWAMLGCLALVRGEAVQAHEAFQESFRRYRLLNAAAELGTALGGLALTQLVLGRRKAALAPLWETLGIAINTHSHFTSITTWVALVAYLADSGHYEQALEVYAAGQAVPLLANSRWEAALAAPWVAVAEEHLPPEAVQAALQRGHGRDLFAVYAELLDEFLTPPAVNLELQE